MEKEGNKKKTKRRLLLLVLITMVTALLLGTTSYAWFTANETVTVNTINVNVAAQNGIQISVDGTEWKSIIQTTDISGAHITYPGSVNQLPAILEPVSAVPAADASGRLGMYYGVVDTNDRGDYILTATKETDARGADGKYVAFDLFLKVTDGINLYLTQTTGVSAAGDDSGIKNAARMGFVVLGNVESDATLDEVQTKNDGINSDVYFYEPNYDVHTTDGVTYAHSTYGITTTTTNATRISYEGLKAPATRTNNILLRSADSGYHLTADTVAQDGTTYYTRTGDSAPFTYTPVVTPVANPVEAGYYVTFNDIFDPVTIAYATPSGFTNGVNPYILAVDEEVVAGTTYYTRSGLAIPYTYTAVETPAANPKEAGYYVRIPDVVEIFPLASGITKIRVYMWVEGQDVDCENTASGGNIDFNLQFTISEQD